jgi:SAM-dependent methyltransferase
MRSIAIGLLLSCLTLLSARGQSAEPPRPTSERIALAEIEVRRLVPLLRFEPGMTVADVGAGYGAWTLRLSLWTGTSGHVYATDVAQEQLAALRALVAREKLTNVTIIEGASAATNLPSQCWDAILLRNVFHYLREPAAMIRSLTASLKPGGRLAVVDFPPRPNTKVPEGVSANRGGFGVPAEVVEREVAVLLRHVSTVPDWAPEGVPSWAPPEFGRPFVVIFEKMR